MGGVTPWPQDVNLPEKLYKLEREFNFLRNLPAEDTKDYKEYDRVTSKEKLVEIIVNCVPSWCEEAVELAREISGEQETDMICGRSVAVHRQRVPERRHADKSVRQPSYRQLKRQLKKLYDRKQLERQMPSRTWVFDPFHTPPAKSSQRHTVKFGGNVDFVEDHDEVMENAGSDEKEHESGQSG